MWQFFFLNKSSFTLILIWPLLGVKQEIVAYLEVRWVKFWHADSTFVEEKSLKTSDPRGRWMINGRCRPSSHTHAKTKCTANRRPSTSFILQEFCTVQTAAVFLHNTDFWTAYKQHKITDTKAETKSEKPCTESCKQTNTKNKENRTWMHWKLHISTRSCPLTF